VDLLEDLQRQKPDDLGLQEELAVAYSTVAGTLMGPEPAPEKIDEALAFYRRALAIDERIVAATEGRNATYVRSLFGDRTNIAYLLNAKQDYRNAAESARAAREALASLEMDENNAQSRFDGAQIGWHLGHALLGAGEVEEAKTILEQSADVLEELALSSDTLQVQYTLGAVEQCLGHIQTLLATSAASDSTRLEHWRLASGYYERAMPRFELVMSNVTLDYFDRIAVNEATAGLARAAEEIAKLAAPTP
jgi:tetratricopeptide (TPR) repeat protein